MCRVQNLARVPVYVDTCDGALLLGGNEDHELRNNLHQSPVQYESCTNGYGELGFRTWYLNTLDQSHRGGLCNGAEIGVIGDSSTSQGGAGGGVAPDGEQYFFLEDTHGFVYVALETVSVSAYRDVVVSIYVHVESSTWEPTDILRTWVADSPTGAELSLLSVTNFDHDSSIVENAWVQYTEDVTPVFSDIAVHFGLQCNGGMEEVWFDMIR